jgi:hypothetical protein
LSLSFSRVASIFSRMFEGFLFVNSFLITYFPRVVFRVQFDSLSLYVY